MYKLILAWRYLRTRYIALASIVSVTLGVGTLIVVNSVMAGFAHEMHQRLHGILADVIIEAHGLDGFEGADAYLAQIRRVLGDDLVGATKAVHVPAMVQLEVRGQYHPKQITLIGVEEATYAEVSDFKQFLLHPENRRRLSFELREDGYGDQDHPMPPSGWHYRRIWAEYKQEALRQEELRRKAEAQVAGAGQDAGAAVPSSPFAQPQEEGETMDLTREQFTGIILGIAVGSVRQRDERGQVQDYYLCRPGDDVNVLFASAGTETRALREQFTVVDFYESKMSEYDAGFAFVPLAALQKARGMGGAVTTIQLKLRTGADLKAARDKLRAHFPPNQHPFSVRTWRDMQGPLLAAVQMETTLLNILLFLIIAVAGFGILATFFMIVVEKTKDIGILKSLGASSGGVMSIFLGYGFSLGLVGAGVGMVGGILFVLYINDIAKVVEWVTGHEVFDPTVYYFQQIPTILDPLTIAWVMAGAVLIAVLASVLPALRAARLHPVQALRYE
jgi:lipoprotein-releasing system permease protein